MVVVAIIGVLTSVAIPNFKRYQAKSKTSEAKIQLAGVYSAQITMQSDYDHFGTCLLNAGFSTPTNNYYAIGHSATNNTANALVRGEGGECADGATFQFAASKKVGGVLVGTSVHTAQLAATVDNTGETFTASAVGYIDKDFNTAATASIWSIDETKDLSQERLGY